MNRFVLFSCLLASLTLTAVDAVGQLNPTDMLKPLKEQWPTYCGDYTCKRYSQLNQINQSNVQNLNLAFVARVTPGSGGVNATVAALLGGSTAPTIIGGEEATELTAGATTKIAGGVLEVNGILYASAPDNAWAVDARDGHVIWHYFWKTKGGTRLGNRGMAMSGDWLYFETPDDYLVSLDARNGHERWHKTISSLDEHYFSSVAPIVIGKHVLVGTGDDLDEPGFLQSFDPETGDLQWKTYTVPMNPGDPGLDTWPNLDAARHGGGQVWIPGAYDADTHLYIFGTGNATPAYTPWTREGDNLFTCTLVAMNVDTGKMQWYFQTSPHDTHDWDSTQTPILVDQPFNGRSRKLVMQATRNGYFFVLDRVTGEHLLTTKFSSANWATKIDDKGRPVRNPEKDATIPGALVSPTNGGSTNWPPPTFSPDTSLFYLPSNDGFSMYYLTETDPHGAMGLGGVEEDFVGALGSYITAIDYKTGKVAWRHKWSTAGLGGGAGLLSTAGKLLFGTDGKNLIAFDAANGNILWHAHIGTSNAPETYMLDGKQYVIVGAGDEIYGFALSQPLAQHEPLR